MGVRNTTKSDVYYNGQLVGKLTDASVSVSRDNLPTTGVGQQAATSAKGLRESQVSCTFIYDPDNSAGVALANSIWNDDEEVETLRIVTQRGNTRADFTMEVISVSLGTPVRVRELINCSMQLAVQGDLSGRF
ncbi:MAG: hypothetical protein N3Z28_03820 [Synechococcaceae cyanobacterium MAG-AL2]|uniref:hypothetical protein n=1 Tax=Candidatus Regnicoccus frigidus TaxID=3074015 RepID=UPI002827E508|nr:hypothetical protein [Candidatus Regnicoccus frigidus]MCT4366782.1 hypothetical protein [Candidatus Regnicoccus frigidus MAG-AL2]